jgi:leader peptidase (prepilin peptidase) / N-methyltransferase
MISRGAFPPNKSNRRRKTHWPKVLARLSQNNFVNQLSYFDCCDPSSPINVQRCGKKQPFVMEALLFPGFFLLLCVLCGVLALVDMRRGIIPDGLNLAVAVAGLARAIVAGGVMDGAEAVRDAIISGAICWLLRRLYFSWRKMQGLGLGDVKFLAAAAVWVGLSGIPMLILIAAVGALVAAGGLQIAGHSLTRQTPLPFGPFLAIGLLSTLALQQWLGA